MTINITPQIHAAYEAYLNEEVDWFIDGQPILRRNTYPYIGNPVREIVAFAAGFQAGAAVSSADFD